jgi:hypothetical protein
VLVLGFQLVDRFHGEAFDVKEMDTGDSVTCCGSGSVGA